MEHKFEIELTCREPLRMVTYTVLQTESGEGSFDGYGPGIVRVKDPELGTGSVAVSGLSLTRFIASIRRGVGLSSTFEEVEEEGGYDQWLAHLEGLMGKELAHLVLEIKHRGRLQDQKTAAIWLVQREQERTIFLHPETKPLIEKLRRRQYE